MNYLTEKRLARTEQPAQQIGMISKPAQETFTFIDDPEGVEKCRRENPDAFIIHLTIVDPPAARHKSPNCTCYGTDVELAQRTRGSSFTGEYPRHRIVNRWCRCVSRLKPGSEERQSYFGSQPRDWVLMRMRPSCDAD
jgi:hypothetical protein